MPDKTVEELALEIEKLTAENETLKNPPEAEAEKTVKLYWPHNVTDVGGAAPSAYGVPLTKEKHYHFGMVLESRAEMELTRKGVAFSKTVPKAPKKK